MLLNKRPPLKYIFNKVKTELTFVLLTAIVVYFVTQSYHDTLPEMPLTIPVFLGTSISILLSFKMNQSYDRWWEARKVWGSIVNDSRSLVMQLKNMVPPDHSATIKTMALRQAAFPYTLGNSLRGTDLLKYTDGLLTPEEIKETGNSKNLPLALLNLHARDLAKLKSVGAIDNFTHIQIDNTLVRLCDSMGRAERIKSTVFPVTYRLFLHMTIYLFVILLSISLTNVEWQFEIPLLLLISAAFFLLEKTATHMQDPFENKPNDTAMTAIASKIEVNIRELIGVPNLQPNKENQDNFYIL